MQGRFQEAKLRFESALREAERVPEKADTLAMALSNLASVKIDLGRLDEAARLCGRAISILIRTAGEADSRVQRLRTELAELYPASGQDSTAEKLLRQTVALQARTSQTATPEGAYTLDILACFYARRNKLALAEKTERQALSVLEAISGSGSLSIAASSLHLSMFLNSRKRATDALPYAEQAMATFKALPEPQPFLEAAARMSLASIYAGLGRGDEARAESEGLSGSLRLSSVRTILKRVGRSWRTRPSYDGSNGSRRPAQHRKWGIESWGRTGDRTISRTRDH